MTPEADDRSTAEGATHEVRIESVAAGGAGVARLPGGRVCFVHRTAPGDRARIRVTTLKPSWARGELVELLEAGPGRRPAPCPFYERCGGCTLEHLVYDTQLDAKARIVADALERIGGVAHPPVGAVRPSPAEFGYRSRVSFHLRRLSGGRVVAGFHRLERPGRIVDVDGRCRLPEAPLVRCWDDLRDAWGPGARRLPDGTALRLTLRRVVGGVVLVIDPERATERHTVGMGAPAELLERVEELTAVWWRPAGTGSPDAGDTPDDSPRLLAGDAHAREEWAGREVRTRSGAFLQVNRPAALAVHDAVLRAVGDVSGRRVVDGYCGVGSYGRRLARAGASAVGIERDAEAADAARADAPPGFRVLEGRVEDRLDEALPADLVLLNPPRSGLDEAVPARLRASGVARIVYVSCDPATLARDVGRLDPDYRIVDLQAFDLFPQTAHVEVLVVLERDAGSAADRASEPPGD